MRVRLAAAVAVIVLSGAIGGAPAGVLAQATRDEAPSKEKSGKEKGKRPGGQVDQITGKRLNEALEALKAEKYSDARNILSKLDAGRLSPYELSRVEQLLAAVDQGEGKYGPARDHLKKAIASGGLNDQEASAVRYQIAQFYMAEEKYREGVEALKEWFATATNPNSAAYYLLGIAYYQLGDYASALEPAQKAVELSEKPLENWLQLLLALRIEREEFKLAVPILKRLIAASPAKKNYWIQLSSVSAQLGNYQEAAAWLQLAYNGGLLTEERDVTRLAQLLLQIEVPYRAAQILTKAMEQNQVKSDAKVYELLGNCWIAAREYAKAVVPLSRAADLSDTGELYMRLGEVLVQREDWASATDALNRALQKGKLKNTANAQLLLGIAFYSQKKPQEARSWFERARNDAAYRSQADGWIRQIELDLSSKG
jgi:tetratricopeptide (TPR) repeat protein